jgi:hypothetical protein
LLGSLPETVFFTFLHSYICTCLEFYHGLTHPVLFLYFFSFPLLGTLSETFFLLFSYIATYVHAWNFTRSCSFSTFLFMSVAT